MLQHNIGMNIDHFINVLFLATSIKMNELFNYHKIRILVIRKVSSPTRCQFHPLSHPDG